MASIITINTNLAQFADSLKSELTKALDPENLIRPALLNQVHEMHRRIHVDGKASDGGLIGEYSKGYLAVRSGVFQNSPRVSRGVNKGKVKNAGVFTAGINPLKPSKKEGKPRPNFHRGSDPKVIISLTRHLENSYAVVAAAPNGYGISFTNETDYDKSQFVEKTYSKPIFPMTAEEEKRLLEVIEETLNHSLNG